MNNRRSFFKNSGLLTLGGLLINPLSTLDALAQPEIIKKGKAKNIIFLVSDGMSSGTLSMANIYKQRKYGFQTNWLQLYTDNKVTRALMDTASASSIITDSAAGGSAWGGGFRVNNGSLNIGKNGEQHLPIWQKFKMKGKKVGCVTTVPITHATPASFCTAQKSRNAQEEIAEHYLKLRFDVMMGGGSKYFKADLREDKKDMITAFKNEKFSVVQNKAEMTAINSEHPVLGLFATDGLPYSIDYNNDKKTQEQIPTLAEMTEKAIQLMQNHSEGFVLQVEAGKVDWAAHGNDIAALLYDQLAFDDAIKIALDFAEKDKNTLVIITTDHGNANPGLIYGEQANSNFENLSNFKNSNDFLLQSITPNQSVSDIQNLFESTQNIKLKSEEAQELISYYKNNAPEDGVYNYKKLPFKALADIQKKQTSVGWISMDHSSDHVEVAVFGPGNHLLKPFIKNTDLHYLMLEAAEIENKF